MRKMIDRIKRHKGKVLCIGGYIVCGAIILCMAMRISNIEDEKSGLEKEYVSLYNIAQGLNDTQMGVQFEYSALNNDFKVMKKSTKKLLKTIKQLDKDNTALKEENNRMLADLKNYERRAELFDKYQYAIYNDCGRTDFTYGQVEEADTIMKNNGLDANLLFSIAMTESSGKQYATSNISTARGYGQLLKGTATFVYKDIMQQDYYDHSMAYNGYVNVSIMANYLTYLRDRNSNVYDLIYEYRGERDYPYLCKVDSFLRKGGSSLEDMNNILYNR